MNEPSQPQDTETPADDPAASAKRRWMERHPLLTMLGVLAVISLLILLLAEVGLRIFAPVRIATIGHLSSDKAAIYGWGFNGGEQVKILDPDTQERYISYTNSAGWRDREHSIDKPAGVYRIVFIGDSNTYGAIVREREIYFRVLEDSLRGQGYDVECIGLAYGNFGTDQELEVLIREGLAYDPDLVVLQFTANDISDNVYRDTPNKRDQKPFYYDLGPDGELRKHDNPDFELGRTPNRKERVKALIKYSEVGKRLYSLALNYRLANAATMSVDPRDLKRLPIILDRPADDPLFQALRDAQGPIEEGKLRTLLAEHLTEDETESILPLFENRWFLDYWSEGSYLGTSQVPTESWELLTALYDEFHARCQAAGVEMAVVSDIEQGQYKWNRSWHRVGGTEAARDAYFQPQIMLESYLAEADIDFIPFSTEVTRARNDPHPNAAGNVAMAKSIEQWLLTTHRDILAEHRLAGAGPAPAATSSDTDTP